MNEEQKENRQDWRWAMLIAAMIYCAIIVTPKKLVGEKVGLFSTAKKIKQFLSGETVEEIVVY